MRARAAGCWTVLQDLLWTDLDTWMPLLKQLAPELIMPEWRIRRLAHLRELGAVERLRNWELRE